jgi:hypothetical protein
MMELAAAGVPSILIPYPYAADNHQEKMQMPLLRLVLLLRLAIKRQLLKM